MSKIAFLDLETSGLPVRKGFNRYHDPKESIFYDPSRIIEVGLVICQGGHILTKESFLIKPDDFTITNSHIHGISQQEAELSGLPIREALEKVSHLLGDVSKIVCHNKGFDINILLSECYRYQYNNLAQTISNLEQDCTMELGKLYMKVSKSPKLIELYEYLFSKKLEQKHRALDDAEACQECFYKMTH